MPNGTDAANQVAELLSVPLEQLLSSLGRGIGEAQSALDQHSIDIQRQIDEDPVLGQYGLRATWYQIPSTQLELKIAVAVQQRPQPAEQPPPPLSGFPFPGALPRIYAQPVNARYANQFGYDASAASTMTLTVVPVPPPPPAAAGRPTRTVDEVLAIAGPQLVQGEDGTPRGRVTATFNGGARAWYVLQTDETTDPPTLERMVRVDDESGAITKQITPGIT
jgi:hypothetical protein